MTLEEQIKSLYIGLLGREPDSEGFLQHLRHLKEEGRSFEDIFMSILASSEFKQKQSRSAGLQAEADEVYSTYPSHRLSPELYKNFAENNPPRRDNAVVNWIGDVYPPNSFPVLPDPASWKSPIIPVPGDGFRAAELEWFGFCLAITFGRHDSHSPLVMAELGCSQGLWCLPWIRQSIKNNYPAVAYGYEASSSQSPTVAFWQSNFGDRLTHRKYEGTGIEFHISDSESKFYWFNNAISSTTGQSLHFPKIDCSANNGAELVLGEASEVAAYDIVHTVSLEDVISQCGGTLDFLHIDIQGAELGIINTGGLACLQGTTSVVLLGTHSIPIHLSAYSAMRSLGFQLVSSSPPIINEQGRVQCDGEQLWVSQNAFQFAVCSSLIYE